MAQMSESRRKMKDAMWQKNRKTFTKQPVLPQNPIFKSIYFSGQTYQTQLTCHNAGNRLHGLNSAPNLRKTDCCH